MHRVPSSVVAAVVDIFDVERDVEHGGLVALHHRGRLERGTAVHERPVPRPRSLRLARRPSDVQPARVAIPWDRQAARAREARPPDSVEAAADVVLLETPVSPQFAHLLAGRGGEFG